MSAIQPPQDSSAPLLSDNDDYVPVPLQIDGQSELLSCQQHGLPQCAQCGVDFGVLNALTRTLKSMPQLAVPPPPNVVFPHRSMGVNKVKEDGNARFREGKHGDALKFYTLGAEIAAGRPLWENNQIGRDELAMILCNRSAAYYAAGDFLSSYADADACVKLKRPWTKAHFRKGKALAGLKRWDDARQAYQAGLEFEPNSADLLKAIAELPQA